MIRRPPRSTLMTHSFPTRRSSDLADEEGHGRRGACHRAGRAGNARGPAGAVAPLCPCSRERDFGQCPAPRRCAQVAQGPERRDRRSDEHTSELQSLMRISYAVFCLKNKNKQYNTVTLKQTT